MLTNNNNYFHFPLPFLWAILTEQKKTSSKTTNSFILITRHIVNWNGGSIANYCFFCFFLFVFVVPDGMGAKQMRREAKFSKKFNINAVGLAHTRVKYEIMENRNK